MGDVDHGVKIVREFSKVRDSFPYHFGFKLQYRNLDTFIHPAFKDRMDLKYVKRFSETHLEEQEWKMLIQEMKALGFVTICTPFDEVSVDRIEEHELDIIKIASCSFTDWPLLERVVKTNKPIIASTAGVSLEDIDKVVSFFEHREKDFALMHCVAEYPTPDDHLQLNQIDLLKRRYPQTRVGYSTHERPDNFDAIKLAVAKGASIFEKHVGIPTDQYKLNLYSASPEQVSQWLEAANQAFNCCGVIGKRPEFRSEEISSLVSLRRGVFSKRAICKGDRVGSSDIFFAIPTTEGQITANDVSKYTDFIANQDIEMDAPLLVSQVLKKENRELVYRIVQRVKDFLLKSGVPFPPKVDMEISHHYGIDSFDEYGLTMMTIVNREYCKKLIILLPGQKHPEQYHKMKEETFHILFGDLQLKLDGDLQQCSRGEVVVIERGVKHSFCTDTGVVIEEISSTHYQDDSFYTDPAINENHHRKTLLTYWLA